MSVRPGEHVEEHTRWLQALVPATRERIQHAWPEAARLLSAQGLDRYAQAAVALQALGRGPELVHAWLVAAPQVAHDVGEDVLDDMAATALKLASKTSGAVIERVLSTAPTAARRLGDAALFLQYLQFLDTLLAQVPRGLRPMLDQLDRLLTQLTLGGLRRWATWGVHAHRTHLEEQVHYFGLASKESLAVLQNERKGTLLVDVQRRIHMYLRALWGQDFAMRPTAGDFESREGYRPFVEDRQIHLPDAFDAVSTDRGTVPAAELYRAAAAHAVAHLVHTRPLSAESLDPWQMACVALVEDARVEALAVARFPGLCELWCRLHTATPALNPTSGELLSRLARALLDPTYTDDHPWVVHGKALWAQQRGRVLAQPHDNAVSREVGVALAHAFRDQVGLPFHPRTDLQTAAYRDDNRCVWAFEGTDFNAAPAMGSGTVRPVRKHVSLMELANALDVETAGDDAQEIWVLGTELFPYEDMGVSYNEREGREPVIDPVYHPEWDHQIQLERPAWVTVQERRPKAGDPAVVDAIVTGHRRLIGRMKRVLDALQPHGVQRLRKLEDGDDIDLNAALAAQVALRMGHQPDPRVMARSVRKVRDLSVLVLVDLSASTNDRVTGQDQTVLDLTRQACVLLADAMAQVGDPFAIHGFCSDGRHDVRYWRFKDFHQPYDDGAKARLAGMTGQLSTRMGAAIRHAAATLQGQPTAKKLLLVITDGEPADVDVRDPQYLRQDARKAVEEAGRHGVQTFCMSLDPRADPYVSRIFGARRYRVVDRVDQLPEKLPLLYAGLTR